MSGAEANALLGVISSIIAIINGTKQVYDANKGCEVGDPYSTSTP